MRAGLGFVPRACVIPHHDTFGRSWAPRLAPQLPEAVLIGVDEQTGMLDDGAGQTWRVAGRGEVRLYWRGGVERYAAGAVLELPPRRT